MSVSSGSVILQAIYAPPVNDTKRGTDKKVTEVVLRFIAEGQEFSIFVPKEASSQDRVPVCFQIADQSVYQFSTTVAMLSQAHLVVKYGDECETYGMDIQESGCGYCIYTDGLSVELQQYEFNEEERLVIEYIDLVDAFSADLVQNTCTVEECRIYSANIINQLCALKMQQVTVPLLSLDVKVDDPEIKHLCAVTAAAMRTASGRGAAYDTFDIETLKTLFKGQASVVELDREVIDKAQRSGDQAEIARAFAEAKEAAIDSVSLCMALAAKGVDVAALD